MNKKIKNLNYKVISLGGNCLPRTILTRWGIKPMKSNGELSMPFDLATYETFEITNLIKSDFNDFFEDLEFKPKKSIFNFFAPPKGLWIKSPDKIEFVHEKRLTPLDKNKLINIYQKRINNFVKGVASPTPTLFVQILGDCQDVENLYNEIKIKRNNLPFKMLIIDTQDIVNFQAKNITVLKLPFPSENYKRNWWKRAFYKSLPGLEFEEKIANEAISIINSLNVEYYK